MRAVVLRGGRLEARETDDPMPGPNELLLRTLSTASGASEVHFMGYDDDLIRADDGWRISRRRFTLVRQERAPAA